MSIYIESKIIIPGKQHLLRHQSGLTNASFSTNFERTSKVTRARSAKSIHTAKDKRQLRDEFYFANDAQDNSLSSMSISKSGTTNRQARSVRKLRPIQS